MKRTLGIGWAVAVVAASLVVVAPASSREQGAQRCGPASGGLMQTTAVTSRKLVSHRASSTASRTHLVSGYAPGDQMLGSLKGTWTVTFFDEASFTYNQATGVMTFRVTELFTGTVDGIGGGSADSISFKGFVVQRFKPGTPLEATTAATWVDGQCIHAVTGGTGAFKGASGAIYFRDITFDYDANYWGVIRF